MVTVGRYQGLESAPDVSDSESRRVLLDTALAEGHLKFLLGKMSGRRPLHTGGSSRWSEACSPMTTDPDESRPE